MQCTIQSFVKSCRSCQVNKRHGQKYGHVPPKLVITTPWEALCVDLIGPYTLNGKDGSSIDCMCLTMIVPATSWFEIVKLPKLQRGTSGSKVTNKNTKEADLYFDKTSVQISNLVYKTWFSRYPQCRYLIYNNGSKFKLHFQALCDSYGIKRKPTSVKNPQANALAGNVADMSRHVANDTPCRSNFGQMGPCCRHFFQCRGSLCRLEPTFTSFFGICM
jgi:hypothetical protein